MGFRFTIVIAVFALAYASLVFNLYQVQIEHGQYYLAKAESWHVAAASREAKRGTIYFTDIHDNRLAVALNKDFPVIVAVPKDIDDPAEAANQLAPILSESPKDLEEKFTKENDPYELLANKVDEAVAEKVNALKIKGIYVSTQSERFYPFDSFASHLLGYVGPVSEGVGKKGYYGIEEYFEERLAGIAGAVDGTELTPPRAGGDVVLTIDPNIQMEAERILNDLVKKHDAAGGGVIIADPETGKIVALAGAPMFNPNMYQISKLEHFINPMAQKIYEPGSTVKVITMAAGIDSGKIAPETTYVDRGRLTLSGRVIENYDFAKRGPYGKVNMSSIIEHSINTGAVFIEREMGRQIFKEYFVGFGLGERTGVTLPGELKGDVRRLNPKERDIVFATASYGQGIAVTPLELIRAVGAIANRGNLMKLYLEVNGEPEIIRRVVSRDTAEKVVAMMISAVDKAEVAKIEGYTLAGKTGTAYVPDFKKGGYTEKVINTYVGFGPASNPAFIVLIKLDEPAGAPVAALTVVPAFRDLAQFMLNYYNIPPDRIENRD